MKLISLLVLSATTLSALPSFASERPHTHPATSIIIVGGRPATTIDTTPAADATLGRIPVGQLLSLNPQPLPPRSRR